MKFQAYNIKDLDFETFYKIPRALLINNEFKNISLLSKLIYVIALEELTLTMKFNDLDYIPLNGQQIADILNITHDEYNKCIEELINNNLMILNNNNLQLRSLRKRGTNNE